MCRPLYLCNLAACLEDMGTGLAVPEVVIRLWIISIILGLMTLATLKLR